MNSCLLHLTCEASCRGRYRGPWISPALLDLIPAWSETLAHNLATAAGLCRSFTIGGSVALDSAMGIGLYQWRPGCGRSAP